MTELHFKFSQLNKAYASFRDISTEIKMYVFTTSIVAWVNFD